MVKRLKKRFMLISLLSVFAALIVLVASMNIINYRKLVSDSDRILVADTTADYTLPEEYDDVLEVGLEYGTHYSPETILRKTPGRSIERGRRFRSMDEWRNRHNSADKK